MGKKNKPHSSHSPASEHNSCDTVKVHGSVQVFDTEEAIKQHNAERGEDKSYNDSTKDYETRSIFWARIAVIISVLYFGTTVLIFHQSKRSADTAQQALVSVQRAFMTYADTPYRRLANKTADGNNWTFQAHLVNNGTTPAVAVLNQFWAEDLDEKEVSEKRFIGENPKEVRGATGTVGPKDNLFIGPRFKNDSFVFGDAPISPDWKHPDRNVPHISARNVSFWGWVLYRDVFESTPIHLTEFCQHLQGIVVNPGGGIELKFSNCREHNCTDQYCGDYKELLSAVFN